MNSMTILIPCKTEPRIADMIRATEECFPESRIVVANDRYGRGKGWAVRQALTQAQGEYVCMIDGDLDVHPRMIKRLIPFLEDYDIVVGKKQIRGFLSRRIISRLSRLVALVLFGLNIDTQTGVKIYKRSILPSWITDSYAFDMEILALAKRSGHSIIEVPVEVSYTKRMLLSSVLKTLTETLKIWLRLHTPDTK